jgi:uncharacterized membrane protein
MPHGTFGGPNASFHGFTRPINERGVAAGCADSSLLDPNFSIQNPYFSNDHVLDAYVWANGMRTRLQTLAAGTNACTQWINDQGSIVGASDIGVIDPLTGIEQIRAVLWDRNGKIHNLGTLGGNGSVAWVINNAGQVAGDAMNDIPDDVSVGTQTHSFLWRMVISTVAHVGLGALLLATTAILTIRLWLIGLQPAKIKAYVAGRKYAPSIDMRSFRATD